MEQPMCVSGVSKSMCPGGVIRDRRDIVVTRVVINPRSNVRYEVGS